MGIPLFSSCSCDCCHEAVSPALNKKVEQLTAQLEEMKKLPNPDPKNFKFKRILVLGEYVLVWLNYPDCINYEGDKILVFQSMGLEDVMNMEVVDPHFCDGDHSSPVARFEPTDRGWKMAATFVKGWRGCF